MEGSVIEPFTVFTTVPPRDTAPTNSKIPAICSARPGRSRSFMYVHRWNVCVLEIQQPLAECLLDCTNRTNSRTQQIAVFKNRIAAPLTTQAWNMVSAFEPTPANGHKRDGVRPKVYRESKCSDICSYSPNPFPPRTRAAHSKRLKLGAGV